MGVIRLDRFSGVIKKVAPQLIPDNSAQHAANCKFQSGDLEPWKAPLTIATPAKVGTKRAIHLFNGATWFHWLTEVDVVRLPIANTTERTCFTGDGWPKQTDATIATAGGGTSYPNNSYLLGIPAPTVTPGVAVQGTASNQEQIEEENAYVYTFVSAWGEEGPPSPASAAAVLRRPDQSVLVSNLPTAPPNNPVGGSYNINRVRVYRTNAGSFQFVAELAIPVTSGQYTDTKEGDALGEVIPSAEWDPPPNDMAGLISLPDGVVAGFVGNEVLLSIPNQPHAWPVRLRFVTDYPVVALGSFGNALLVTTTGTTYIITGTATDSPYMEKLELSQACVAKRGLASLGGAVLYPSPDGLMFVSMGALRNVTEKILSRDQWQALNPSTMIAGVNDGRYFCFYNNGSPGGFVFDLEGGLSFIDGITVTATYTDLLTDSMYLMIGNDVRRWDGGAALAYTWKSRLFSLQRPENFGAGRVSATGFPVTVKVYADGVLIHTETAQNNSPFRLPPGFLATDWEVEVSGTNRVRNVELATTISALAP
jgi:hypothetical protein